MSEEEKIAIEKYKTMIESDPKGTYRNYIDTVIYNLIKKQEKEIEQLKTEYLIPNYICKEIKDLQTENEELKKLLEGNLYNQYLYYKNLVEENKE